MLALLLLEVNWICVLLRLVSTQLDSIIEERVRQRDTRGVHPIAQQKNRPASATRTVFSSSIPYGNFSAF